MTTISSLSKTKNNLIYWIHGRTGAIDVPRLELWAEFDLAALFTAVDEDEVCVMRIEEAGVCLVVGLCSPIVDSVRHCCLILRL